jgi:hypothetical protein
MSWYNTSGGWNVDSHPGAAPVLGWIKVLETLNCFSVLPEWTTKLMVLEALFSVIKGGESRILVITLLMIWLVVIDKTHISGKHHFLVSVGTCTLVRKQPLVLVDVATNFSFRTPRVENQSFEVVVVEFALLFSRRPVAIVTRVLRLGRTNSVSTRNSSGEGPRPVLILVDMIHEDLLQTIFSILTSTPVFWIGHSFFKWARVSGSSTVFEAFSQLVGQRGCSESKLSVVVNSGSAHGGLSSNNKEISQRDLILKLAVDSWHVEFGKTFRKTFVVRIFEIDAPIRTTGRGTI